MIKYRVMLKSNEVIESEGKEYGIITANTLDTKCEWIEINNLVVRLNDIRYIEGIKYEEAEDEQF